MAILGHPIANRIGSVLVRKGEFGSGLLVLAQKEESGNSKFKRGISHGHLGVCHVARRVGHFANPIRFLVFVMPSVLAVRVIPSVSSPARQSTTPSVFVRKGMVGISHRHLGACRFAKEVIPSVSLSASQLIIPSVLVIRGRMLV